MPSYWIIHRGAHAFRKTVALEFNGESVLSPQHTALEAEV
jgi:hypothetical protein